MNLDRKPVMLGRHTLPPLPYAYNALEPFIDETTMRLHHDKHHKKYVDDLNKAELAAQSMREKNDYQYIAYWENQLAFNGSGHILHSVFWTIMAPLGMGGSPGKYTSSHINWYFGSMEAFKVQFIHAASAVQGSGWAILGYNTAFNRLELLQAEKHQNLTQWGIIPILACDVWEHAYYLKYQNNRDQYIDAWWQIINWNEVEQRFIMSVNGFTPLMMSQD